MIGSILRSIQTASFQRGGVPVTDFVRIGQAGIIAVVRADDPVQAVRAAGALLEGGIRAIELTFTTAGAAEALAELRATYGATLLLGAGTIREPAQVEMAVQAGAGFLVTPHLRPDLLAAMLATGLPCLPGVLTPSEVAQALDAGAQAVKLFPAWAVGPRYIASLRGPFPALQVIPTGGIDADDLPAWFAAGALAVGVGGELVPQALLREGRWHDVTRRAERFAASLRAAREAAAGQSHARPTRGD
jgi:2-dehydro-3-deoxyphosphogluconate aldolase/(4S)-4-hydroxy-2-oxoglutarate aldolase